MENLAALSRFPSSEAWLSQFRCGSDRNAMATMLNRLKLVSTRELEIELAQRLRLLAKQLKARIAVYPVVHPDREPWGTLLFPDGVGSADAVIPPGHHKRVQFGSENRIGHFLQKLQGEQKANRQVSQIECVPTQTMISSQKIRNVVLVDDLTGSGHRMINFWHKTVPKWLKSELSYGRLTLWILVYASTPMAIRRIFTSIPHLPKHNLLSLLPPLDFRKHMGEPVTAVCAVYGRKLTGTSAALGYRCGSCPLVFEYGCPNNLPIILWKAMRRWAPLFTNRAVPPELVGAFGSNAGRNLHEILWDANLPRQALNLLETLVSRGPVSARVAEVLSILLLVRSGRTGLQIMQAMKMSESEFALVRSKAVELGVISACGGVTRLGHSFILAHSNRVSSQPKLTGLVRSLHEYFPQQCEGVVR